jgi:Lon protease-like protein
MIRFEGTCRLFPLPGVVLFPHGVLRLHVFEPRYRQLTAHALETDRLITIVQARPGVAWPVEGEPELEQVGCVGRILAHEGLPDGRSNLILMGVGRVRLDGDVRSPGTLYRQCEATRLDDLRDRPGLDGERRRLADELQTVPGCDNPELRRLIESAQDMGHLIDLVAHALPLGASAKQRLLDEPRVGHRLDGLRRILRESAGGDPGLRGGFSAN